MTNILKKEWGKIADLASAINAGETSAVANVKESLRLIDEAKEYNAVLHLTKTRALDRAKKIDELVKSSKSAGRLAGVPFIAKDNYLTFDTETTAASNILAGFKAPYQATVIEKLEAEGAIMVAKANLDSFAHGGSTENSDFDPTKNAVDPARVPGGSSGGSATAVALGLAPFALGSDTGGSIRQPASFSGIVGLKPSYGSVSRYGVVAMASSTDCMGPMTANTEDAALIYDVIAGQDTKDSTTTPRKDNNYTKLSDSKLKIGVIKEHMSDGINKEVRSSISEAVDKLKTDGHEVTEISIPELEYSLACYYIIIPAEISSNLARYDGIRFGFSNRKDQDLEGLFNTTRAIGFNSENKRRIMIGNYVLSSGYYDAYYKRAQKVRTLLIKGFEKALEQVDVLVGPVTPNTAFKIGEKFNDPVAMYLEDLLTVGVSLAGLPAISVPVSSAEGLPVGMQITGKYLDDKTVLSAAKTVQDLYA